MSAPQTSTTPRRRRWLVVVGGLALLAGIIAVGAPPDETPYDPAGVGPTGLRGVVDLLRAVDVEVEVSAGLPPDTDTRVFVPVDQLGEQRRSELLDWVRAGGTLVVAGRTSALHGLVGVSDPLGGLGVTSRALACGGQLDPLDLGVVGEVANRSWDGLQVPAGAAACGLDDDGFAWLVVMEEGDGHVIALANVEPLTNHLLARADNAVLAAALLAPGPGQRVHVVPRPAVGEGDTDLLDLIAPQVFQGLLVLLVATLLGLVAVGRRLGPPVAERLPPVVAAAELATSLGGLLHRAGDRPATAARLRHDARAVAAQRLGLPLGSAPPVLVEHLVVRTGIDAALARLAMFDDPVSDDGDLLAVARAARQVRAHLDADAGLSHAGLITAGLTTDAHRPPRSLS